MVIKLGYPKLLGCPFFHQGSSGAGLELVANLEPVLHILTAKNPAFSQEALMLGKKLCDLH